MLVPAGMGTYDFLERRPKLSRHRSQSSQIVLSSQEYNSFSVLRAAPDTLSKMDMPIHNEIERSSQHIQEEMFDNDSDYEQIGEDIGINRHGYGMIFDRLNEHP